MQRSQGDIEALGHGRPLHLAGQNRIGIVQNGIDGVGRLARASAQPTAPLLEDPPVLGEARIVVQPKTPRRPIEGGGPRFEQAQPLDRGGGGCLVHACLEHLAEQQRIVRLLVEKVIVSPSDIELRLRANGIEELAIEFRPAVPEEVTACA